MDEAVSLRVWQGLGRRIVHEEIITLKDFLDVKPTHLSNSEMLWERGAKQHVPCLQADYPKRLK